LLTPYNIEVSIFDGGRLATHSIPAFGDVRAANPDGALDAHAGYSWAERLLTIKVGLPSFSYEQFGLIFTGTAEDVTWTWNELAYRVRDYQYKLTKPLQSVLYGGFGAALRGDGMDDALTGSLTPPSGAMTVELIGRPTTLSALTKQILSFNNGGVAGDRVIRTDSGLGNRIVFIVRNDAGTAFSATADGFLAVGRRSHIAMVLDPAALTLTAYVDGDLAVSLAVSGTFLTVHSSFALLKNVFSGTQFADWEIDEFRLWSAARSQSQIQENRNRELLGNEPTLFYYNKMNEQTGGTATPTVGSAVLTVVGCAWVGSLEGDAAIAGKPKPKSYGQVRQVEPVAVDALNLIYQWHDTSVSAVNSLQDGGVALINDGNVTDLYASSVTSGHFKTDNLRGLLRLGALPQGTLTLEGQGDASGSGYVYKAADILRRIVAVEGGISDPDGLDLASFGAANVSNGAVHGFHAGLEPINIEVAVDEIASSVGAFWTYTRTGLLRLSVFTAPGTPVATLTEADVVMDSVSRSTIPPPAKRIRLGYRKYYTIQEGDALATSVTAANRAQFSEEYRFAWAENSSIATKHLDAEEHESTTLMDVLADAQNEALRRIALFGARRQLIQVQLVVGLFTYQLGDTIEFASTMTRYGLANWKGVIVALVEDVGDGTGPGSIQVQLWG
jgi:hypothetical protein